MVILWVIDNKDRELWGLYDIIKKLENNNIGLYLCNKFNWKLAIKYYDPNIIVLPNVRIKSPFQEVVNYAYARDIKVVLCQSEGLNYEKSYLEVEHPFEMVKKLTKIFLWAKEQGDIISNYGESQKTVITGAPRFIVKEKNFKDQEIINIGIPTTNRYSTNPNGTNIPRFVYSRIDKPLSIGLIKNEPYFFECISKIFKRYENKKFNFILKPHPFEDYKIYEEAFPNVIIEKNPDIRVFLNKIDVMINQYSSSNIHSLRTGIPVISLRELIHWNESFGMIKNDYLPTNVGIPVKSYEELDNYLNNFTADQLLEINKKNGDYALLDKVSPNLDSVNLITDELKSILKSEKKKENKFILIRIFNFFKYVLKGIYIDIFNTRKTLFQPFTFKDKKLLKKFSVLN